MQKVMTIVLLILVTFATSRFVFEPSNLYYELPWLDIPMHIVGGFLVGSLFIALGKYNTRVARKSFFFWALFLVMILWEFSEYKRGMVTYGRFYDYCDSLKDVMFGYLGAYIAYKRK
jgi:surface polysaccharide O-acyltransferase-like enzyme